MKIIIQKLPVFLLFLLFFSSCVKDEIPDLGYSIIDDDSVDLFEFTNVEYEFYSNLSSNVRVHFKLHDGLTAFQIDRIESIVVYSEGIYFEFDAERDFFFDPHRAIGSTICYNLLLKESEEIFSRTTTICIVVE